MRSTYYESTEAQQAKARRLNDLDRIAEHNARAERLRADWLIMLGLKALLSEVVTHSQDASIRVPYMRGRTGNRATFEEIRETLKHYDYLDRVPREAFEFEKESGDAGL